MGTIAPNEAKNMPMTIANVEMATAWDGDEGEQWTDYADQYDAVAEPHLRRLMDAARIAAGDRVLDIGCGTGESTRRAARETASGSALGVDLSGRMLTRAEERGRAEGLTNVAFLQADVQVHRFDERTFDVVISRFGAMFFNEPVAAFRNIAKAMRPGGGLALLTWQELAKNEWLTSFRGALAAGRTLPVPPAGTPGPFGLAEPEGVRHILAEAGFHDVDLVALDEAVRFGSDADDAWPFVASMGIVRGLTEGLDADARTKALERLRRVLVAHESAAGVVFASAAWLVTARCS
jgi:SAM-dependent methyltransferase